MLGRLTADNTATRPTQNSGDKGRGWTDAKLNGTIETGRIRLNDLTLSAWPHHFEMRLKLLAGTAIPIDAADSNVVHTSRTF